MQRSVDRDDASQSTHYIMLDHGGVLDGKYSEKAPGRKDLLLGKDEEGYFWSLPNGIEIVKNLTKLVNQYGYKIVFHSANVAEDQLSLLEQLQLACMARDLTFPPVYALVDYDPKHSKAQSDNPHIISDREDGILVAQFGEGAKDGKAGIRAALAVLLNISPKDRENHAVFDDGESVIRTAKEEGYDAYLVNQSHSFSQGLSSLLAKAKMVHDVEAKLKAEKIFLNKYQKYSGLPSAFREYLFKETETNREQFGKLSLKAYWQGITIEQQKDWWAEWSLIKQSVTKHGYFFQSKKEVENVKEYAELPQAFRQYFAVVTEEEREDLLQHQSGEEYWQTLPKAKRDEYWNEWQSEQENTPKPGH